MKRERNGRESLRRLKLIWVVMLVKEEEEDNRKITE